MQKVNKKFIPDMPLSVVIITKNEAHIIGKTLLSLQGIANEIIIVDSGSTDATLSVCRQFNTTIIETTWDGFGNNKNKGIEAAKHDWILSLDADESINEALKAAIIHLPLNNSNEIYSLKRKNVFCGKIIRFGNWGSDQQIRIFNRKAAKWDDAYVHESLTFFEPVKKLKLPGSLIHYTVHSLEEYIGKTINYAKLNAKKYHLQKKKANYFKLIFSPAFTFFVHYILRLGFLDGWEGYFIAKTNAWYTFLKYMYLRDLNKNNNIIQLN
ncbi:MAG: glycosyltransferase family 2 protein [Chitinophagaceae bacterium]|nr:glycosyltransferase family 2 protein [Chitinophagaceae bacterium]